MRNTGSLHQSSLRRTIVAFLLCLPVVLASSRASAVTIALYADQGGTTCTIVQPPLGGLVSVYALLRFTPGAIGAQFSVTPPSCAAYVLLSWQGPDGGYVIGYPPTGIEVGFNSCVTGNTAILTLNYIRSGNPGDCCVIRLTEHPQSFTGEVEVADCSFQVHPANSTALWLKGDDSCAPIRPPSNPSPVDGATEVPTDVTLNAELHGTSEYFSACLPLGIELVTVHFGTDPDPPAVVGTLPYQPPALQSATTYFWKLVHRYFSAAPVSSPVWSFTTESTVAARHSTWGAVKALYR